MSNLFKTYKTGQQISFQIEPICEEEVIDNKVIRKCEPHSDTPEKLNQMLKEIQAVLEPHGFVVEITGHPSQMFKSLQKRYENKE